MARASTVGSSWRRARYEPVLLCALLMLLVAATEFSRHIRRLTPFTHEIFNCFVCSIYVHDGVNDVLGRFDDSSLSSFGDSLFALNLALITLGGE